MSDAIFAGKLKQRLMQSWRLFLGIHVSAQLFTFAILGPVLTVITGWLILASGDVALTDQDIALFFFSPTGLVVLVIGAALVASVLVFETAALQLAIHRAEVQRPTSIWRIGRHLILRFHDLIRLAVFIVLRVLLIAVPFLAVIAVMYFKLLTDYDINYYLTEHPPIFLKVVAVAGILLLLMSVLLLRSLSGWVLALPMMLIGHQKPLEALQNSETNVAGHRVEVVKALVIWLLLSGVGFLVVGGLLRLGSDLAISMAGSSLTVLAYMMGGLLLIWSVANFLVGFIAGACFSLLVYRFYERWANDDATALDNLLADLDKGRGWRVPGRWLLVAVVVVTVLAGTVAWRQFHGLTTPAQPLIIAHRGASIEAPENTLAAIRLAIEQQADFVEIDVQETREGEIVVIHDSDLMKVAGNPLKVFDASLAELAEIDIGSWKSPEFSAERVVTLQDLLAVTKGKVKVNIELKYYGQEQRFEERVAQIIEHARVEDEIVLMSLSLPGVRAMKALRPSWTVGLLSSVGLGDITRLDVDFFAVNGAFANRSFIRSAQSKGKDVLVWTVNDAAMVSAMMSKGVDGIITDRPGFAREVLVQQSTLQTHERLLIQVASMLGSEVTQDQ